ILPHTTVLELITTVLAT
nr:immunoglobulin heavy chain junction region [Mus musculus]